MAEQIPLRKDGAAISVARSGSASKASMMRSRNLPRMMQPPRQTVATKPGAIAQPFSCEAA
jgi:hypothetical protein